MKVSFLPADLETWLRPLPKPRRSAGVHVSKVLTSMLKMAAPRQFGHYGNDNPNRRPNWLLGTLWEEAFERIVREQQIDPRGYLLQPKQELCLDGIYLTPDRTLLAWEDLHQIVDETKLTWMSTVKRLGDDPDILWKTTKYAYWVAQAKTYAAALQEIQAREYPGYAPYPVPEARIVAIFVNADYQAKGEGIMTAVYRWRLEFEREELTQWWANVRDYARDHAKELYEPGEDARDPSDRGADRGRPPEAPGEPGQPGLRPPAGGEPA